MNKTLIKIAIKAFRPYLIKLAGVIEELRVEYKVDNFRMVIENGKDEKGEMVPQLKYRGIIGGQETIIRDANGKPIVYSIDKIIDLVSGIGEDGEDDDDYND